jgi:hypothetical protein
MKENNLSLTVIDKSDKSCLYSISFNDDNQSEFDKFLLKFKDNAVYNDSFNSIIKVLSHMLEVGVKERYFRNEGGNIKALGLDSKKLRLYCLRISDQILIVGNGGIKNTRTYQEDDELNGYVMNLKAFNKMLNDAIKKGLVTIEGTTITSITTDTFKIT